MNNTTDTLETDNTHHRAFKTFSILWSLAMIFHLYGDTHMEDTLPIVIVEILVFLAAVWLLFNPTSLARFGAMLLVSLVNLAITLPDVGNHWFLAGLINLSLLIVLGWMWLANRKAPSHVAFFAQAAPIIRAQIVVFYFFAAFSKLNSDFFDPQISCASVFLTGTANSLFAGWGALRSEAARIASIAFIAGSESLIVLLLAIRRTRTIGVAYAVFFHFVIALDPMQHVFDFSSLLYAAFALFLPASFFDWLNQTAASTYRAITGGAKLLDVFFAVILLGMMGVVLVARLTYELSNTVLMLLLAGRYILWLLFAGVCIFFLAKYLITHRATPPLASAFRLINPLHAIFPLVIFVNGLSPYVGHKTQESFTMYSNLRTEGGVSNHFLVRNPLYLFDYQNDLVTLISSSDKKLKSYAEHKFKLPYIEFRNYVSQRPEIAVTYEHASRRFALARAGDQAEFVAPVSILQSKLMTFRPVGKSTVQNYCPW